MSHTISQTIQLGEIQLSSHLNIDNKEARFDTLLLLQHALNVNRAWLIAHDQDTLADELYKTYEDLFKRRLNGEPIAYILGYREFYGLSLKVSTDTLIPRADTEALVEAALDKIPQMVLQDQPGRHLQALAEPDLLTTVRPELVEGCANNSFKVLDLGTGSGAVALAIAKHRPLAQVTALDASHAALNIAIKNAQSLKIANVNFMPSNWFSALQHQLFDVIVSNPPYIEVDDMHLKLGDLRFEPLSALSSGVDGLDDIRLIVQDAPQHLKNNGWLMLEHGYNQAEDVAKLLTQRGFKQISYAKDLAGIRRVTLGCYVVD